METLASPARSLTRRISAQGPVGVLDCKRRELHSWAIMGECSKISQPPVLSFAAAWSMSRWMISSPEGLETRAIFGS